MTKKTTKETQEKRVLGKTTSKKTTVVKKVVKKSSGAKDIKKVQDAIKENSIAKNKRSSAIKNKINSLSDDKKELKKIAKILEENHIDDPGFLTNQDVFDEADHAQWQQIREQALIHIQAKNLNRAETHPDFDGIHCIECDIEIPAPRLKLNKIRCVDCQQEIEDSNKRNTLRGGGGGAGDLWDKI